MNVGRISAAHPPITLVDALRPKLSFGTLQYLIRASLNNSRHVFALLKIDNIHLQISDNRLLGSRSYNCHAGRFFMQVGFGNTF